MAAKSAKAGKARGQLKAASKTSPGTAALSDVQDLDFIVELMLDEGLERFAVKRRHSGACVLTITIDSESSGKLGALLLQQLIYCNVRFDQPHIFNSILKNSISHAGLQGLIKSK